MKHKVSNRHIRTKLTLLFSIILILFLGCLPKCKFFRTDIKNKALNDPKTDTTVAEESTIADPYIADINKWYQKNLLTIKQEKLSSVDTQETLELLLFLHKISGLLEYERPDIAISDTIILLNENPHNNNYEIMLMLGYLYLGTEQFHQAEDVFKNLLKISTDSDIKIESTLGLFFTSLGSKKQELAFEYYRDLKKLLIEQKGKNEHEKFFYEVEKYFSFPKGMYKMKVSYQPSKDNEEYIERKEKGRFYFSMPFRYVFEINDEYLNYHHIDDKKYPKSFTFDDVNLQ